MIIEAAQRAGAKQLANHLTNTRDNEHAELHELRGFLADDLHGALQEAYAVSRGTRCKQFLFSVSLNPPEDVDNAAYEKAVEKIEDALGLKDQPRAIVFHEKRGRRHAHVVWSRIDPDKMKAINLSHFKLKLREVSRDLYLEHGWKMPNGLVDKHERQPLNFTREQWQQARRAKMDPKQLRAMFRECWDSTTTMRDFREKLEEHGFYLAQGDRRGHVAVDFRGEVYPISRWTGQRVKDVKAKLGEPGKQPTVDTIKRDIGLSMSSKLKTFIKEFDDELKLKEARHSLEREMLLNKQREDRKKMREFHKERWQEEERERAARLPKGLKAVWSYFFGDYKRIRRSNEYDAKLARQRDEAEMKHLRTLQAARYSEINHKRERMQRDHEVTMKVLHVQIAHYIRMGGHDMSNLSKTFSDLARGGQDRNRGAGRELSGPSLER